MHTLAVVVSIVGFVVSLGFLFVAPVALEECRTNNQRWWCSSKSAPNYGAGQAAGYFTGPTLVDGVPVTPSKK